MIIKCKMIQFSESVLRSIKLYFIIPSTQIIINFIQAPHFEFQNF